MKNKIIAAALIRSVIEYKIALLTECAEKIYRNVNLSVVEEILSVPGCVERVNGGFARAESSSSFEYVFYFFFACPKKK